MGGHVLVVVKKGQNERKKNILPQNKTLPRSKCRNVVSRSTHCEKWRIRGWRILRTCSWKSHSCNIPFFYFLCSNYFFFLLTADTSRDEAEAASLSESWLKHDALSLSARFSSIRMKFIDFLLRLGPGFVLLFIQGLTTKAALYYPSITVTKYCVAPFKNRAF